MFTSYTYLFRSALYSKLPNLWLDSFVLLPILMQYCPLIRLFCCSSLTVYTPQLSASILGVFAVFAQLTFNHMSLTVGKAFSSPLAAFFLIPAHCNSNATVIIILKSHSGQPLAQREGSVYQRMHTKTYRAEWSEKTAVETQRGERGRLEAKAEAQSLMLCNDASVNLGPLMYKLRCYNSEPSPETHAV